MNSHNGYATMTAPYYDNYYLLVLQLTNSKQVRGRVHIHVAQKKLQINKPAGLSSTTYVYNPQPSMMQTELFPIQI